MKTGWRILLAFLLPINLAMAFSFIAGFLMRGYKDCDYCFACYSVLGCASEWRNFFADLFGYVGFGLILLSFFLPIIIFLRNRPTKQTKLFD